MQNVTLETKQTVESWSTISIPYTFILVWLFPLYAGSLFQTPSSAFSSYWNCQSAPMLPLVPSFWFPFLFSLLPLPQPQSQAHSAGASSADSMTNTSGFIQDCRDTALAPLTHSWTALLCLPKSRRLSRWSISSFLWRCFWTPLHCNRMAQRLQKWVQSMWSEIIKCVGH